MTFVNLMPESPRWLVKNGQADEALKVLGRLRSDDGEMNDEARKELASIQTALALEAHSRISYFAMFFKSKGKLHMSRRVYIYSLLSFVDLKSLQTQLAIWIQILQEWTGIAAITIYQPIIFA